MSKLIWDEIGKRYYETGVRNGVLYPRDASGAYPLGVAWNGLTAVNESPSGAEPSPLYADDIKYLNLLSAEEFGCTIEAYTYPDEFALCDGSAALSLGVMINQQRRSAFGLCYKTALGNDTDDTDYGYKLHLVYGALAAPSDKNYATINDNPEAITFSWAVTTTPVTVTGFKPTASLTINSTKVDAAKLALLEAILFGTESTNPRLPLPDEIKTLFDSAVPAALTVTFNPLDNATGVSKAGNIVLTFSNPIVNEVVTVVEADGTIVAGTKTWNGARTVLTFNPNADLDGTTTYIVTAAGIGDIYGQSLATTVINFTTAA